MDEAEPTQHRSKVHVIVPILIVIIVILIATLLWCFFLKHKSTPAPSSSGSSSTSTTSTSTAAGPCTGNTANPTPAGFTMYENTSLGYKFAYPTAWGTITVTTTPIGSESGDYIMGHFSSKSNVWFGGNATDYVVRGRDGLPTDLPGYFKASSKYYSVELWKFNSGTATEDRDDLHLLDAPYEEKAGCNATALITHWDASEVSSVGPADIARFNLQPTGHYYGVNFVLDKPDTATRADFDKLVKSFQLIP